MLAIENDDVARALVEVRKAYRLLYVYQCRVIDMMKAIAGGLGCQFYWQGFRAPRDEPLEKPIALLPMWINCFLFLPEKQHHTALKKGDWMLSLRLISDTTFTPPDWDGDPDITKLPSFESAKSVLQFHVYLSLEDQQRDWNYGVWNSLGWPPIDEVHDFDHGIRTYAQVFDLAALATKAAIDAAVSEFKEQLRVKLGIDNFSEP